MSKNLNRRIKAVGFLCIAGVVGIGIATKRCRRETLKPDEEKVETVTHSESTHSQEKRVKDSKYTVKSASSFQLPRVSGPLIVLAAL